MEKLNKEAWRRLTSMDDLERSYADLLTNSKAELKSRTSDILIQFPCTFKIVLDREYRKMLFKKHSTAILHDKTCPFLHSKRET